MNPVDVVRARMAKLGILQTYLAKAGLGTQSNVSKLLNKKRKITVQFIRSYLKLDPGMPLADLIQDYELR